MAVTASVYGKALQTLGEGGFSFTADTLKLLLTTGAYTPDKDTHRYLSDVTNEIVGTGYTAGGKTLTGVTWVYNAGSDRMQLDADNVVWTSATFTTRRGVYYKSTGVAATSPLISWIDFGADEVPELVDFTIVVDATGLFRITAA